MYNILEKCLQLFWHNLVVKVLTLRKIILLKNQLYLSPRSTCSLNNIYQITHIYIMVHITLEKAFEYVGDMPRH